MTSRFLIPLLFVLAACGGNAAGAGGAASAGTEALTRAQVDTLWQRAGEAFRAGKWDDAIARAERYLLEAGNGDARVVDAHMLLGEAHMAKKNRLDAAREFRKVSDETPSHPLAPAALLRVGDAYAELWRRAELDPSYGQSALATYQELLSRYPESDAARQAQERIARLNDKLALKAFKAAKYYLRLRAYDSAIIYLRDLLASYPRAAVAPEALLSLIRAYRSLGYVEDVRETCVYLLKFHPGAPGSEKACPAGLTPADTTATPMTPAPLPAPGTAAPQGG